jgi:hypothetical protein
LLAHILYCELYEKMLARPLLTGSGEGKEASNESS